MATQARPWHPAFLSALPVGVSFGTLDEVVLQEFLGRLLPFRRDQERPGADVEIAVLGVPLSQHALFEVARFSAASSETSVGKHVRTIHPSPSLTFRATMTTLSHGRPIVAIAEKRNFTACVTGRRGAHRRTAKECSAIVPPPRPRL